MAEPLKTTVAIDKLMELRNKLNDITGELVQVTTELRILIHDGLEENS